MPRKVSRFFIKDSERITAVRVSDDPFEWWGSGWLDLQGAGLNFGGNPLKAI
jgi:hypothetical protein